MKSVRSTAAGIFCARTCRRYDGIQPRACVAMAYASPTIGILSDGKWAPSFLLPAQMLKKTIVK